MLKVNTIQELAYIERIRATPGAQVSVFLDQARTLSVVLSKKLIAIHNEHEIIIEPFMSLQEILKQWDNSVTHNQQLLLKKANRG